ncbi:MAG: ACT domain-containing protein [Planctomycetota bacterium]|jgi:hypothetical protein
MSDPERTLTLTPLHGQLSICQVAADEDVPRWVGRGTFVSVTRTPDELSIISPSSVVPAGVRRSDGWRALKLLGPFAFSECGVLASVVTPLTESSISVLAICTFDTDYILVQESDLLDAIEVLEHVGHRVSHVVSNVPNDQIRGEAE